MEQLVNIPRLVIAAPQGRSGKTTISVGLMAALTAKGMAVQAFKKGPDYIDPSWLSMVTGRQCRNLDSFMMGREALRRSFVRHACNADIGIVEGAMGIFDGVDLEGSGSTGEVAKAIQAPVILVVDTTRMTRSVAAMVNGFQHFDPDVKIAGVILNKVARPRHENMLRSAVEHYCGIPVLGAMPKGNDFKIPDRHLGLIPAAENQSLHQAVAAVGEAAARHLDLEKILEVAKSGCSLAINGEAPPSQICSSDQGALPADSHGPVIGVFNDSSFTFYYPENLESLVEAGARLVTVDSINQTELPEVDALYIGGGFPEVFASGIERNQSLREAVREGIEKGLPVYAECGGLMYLGRSLAWQDRVYRMCGALPFDVVMSEKPQGHGYVVLEVTEDNPFFSAGEVLKGHEFHHSRVVNLDRQRVGAAYRIKRGYGIDGEIDGLTYKNVLAGYTHLHAVSQPGWAQRLVEMATEYKETKNSRSC